MHTERPIAYLNYVSYLLAPNKVSNEDLAKRFPKYTPEQIFKNTGIHTRYAVDEGTLSSDFGTACGEKFFQEFPVKKEDIDFLIFCTEEPDYTAPAASCIVQHKLGLPTSIGTFDSAFGCSGYTYGLSMAKALVESGMAKNVLFITTEMPLQAISIWDDVLHLLFSDASSISFISTRIVGQKIQNFIFGTDGSGEKSLRSISSSYKKERLNLDEIDKIHLRSGRLEMDGEAIFRFTLREIPSHIEKIILNNKLSLEDIDLFIFHQASQVILKSLKRKLNIPDEKFFTNLADVGNTVSASIPIALVEAEKQKKIKPGMKILIAGFGIGYSWSGTILET